MGWLSVLLVSVILGVDAFTVAATVGLSLGQVTGRQKFRLTFHFGLFQFFMPILG